MYFFLFLVTFSFCFATTQRERLDDSILVCAPDALERVLERAKVRRAAVGKARNTPQTQTDTHTHTSFLLFLVRPIPLQIPLGVMTHILSAAAEATSLLSLSRPSGASLAFRRNDDDDASFVGSASVLDDGFDESVASIVTQSLIQVWLRVCGFGFNFFFCVCVDDDGAT